MNGTGHVIWFHKIHLNIWTRDNLFYLLLSCCRRFFFFSPAGFVRFMAAKVNESQLTEQSHRFCVSRK